MMREKSPEWSEIDVADRHALEVLQDLDLFRDLTAAGRTEVLRTSRMVTAERGQMITCQGAPADQVYLLLRGETRVWKATSSGQHLLLRILKPKDLIGSILTGVASSYGATAIATEPCAYLRWRAAEFARLMESYPSIAVGVSAVMAAEVAEAYERLLEVATERVECRLARMVLRLVRQVGIPLQRGVEIPLVISRVDFAAMVGTTLFTASRIISVWESRGWVHAGRQKVVVFDPAAIASLTLAEEGGDHSGCPSIRSSVRR